LDYNVSRALLHEKATAIIQALGIHFTKLKNTDDNNEVLKFIFEHSFYTINQDMVQLMLGTYSKNEFHQANTFDSIVRSGCTPLIEYLRTNFQVFITDVYLTHASYESEPEDSLLSILNNADIDVTTKENILTKTNTKISDLKTIDIPLWPLIVTPTGIKTRWLNTVHYHTEYGLDPVLIDYINDKSIQAALASQPLDTADITDEKLQTFFKDLFESPKVQDAAILALVQKCPYIFGDLTTSHISHARIETLILQGKISLTPGNFQGIGQKANQNDLKLLLLLQHPDEFIQSIDQYPLTVNDVTALVKNQKFHPSQKATIIDSIALDQISESNVSELLGATVNEKQSPKQELVEKMLSLVSDKSAGVSFLISATSSYSRDLIPTYLQAMGEPFSNILSPDGVQLDFTESDEHLLQFLKKNNCISDFKREKDHLIVLPLNPTSDQSADAFQ
jgi:hypothetical protein